MKLEDAIGKVMELSEKIVDEPFLTEVGQDMVLDLRQHFEDQGPGWPAINPNYKKWKGQHGYDTRINIKTAELMNSFEALTENGNTAVVRINGDAAEYAPFVNNARKFMYISDAARKSVNDKWLKKMIEFLKAAM